MSRKFDMDEYKCDLPDHGIFGWVTVRFTDEICSSTHIGILLHDGLFAFNGIVYESDEFDIIDYDPNNMHSFWKSKFDLLTDDDLKYYICNCNNSDSDKTDRFNQIEFVISNTVKRNQDGRLGNKNKESEPG